MIEKLLRLSRVGVVSIALAASLAVVAEEAPNRLLNVRDMYPSVSPDGRTLVFESNRSGTAQVYLTEVTEDGRPESTVQLTDAALDFDQPCYRLSIERSAPTDRRRRTAPDS